MPTFSKFKKTSQRQWVYKKNVCINIQYYNILNVNKKFEFNRYKFRVSLTYLKLYIL